MLFRSDLDDEVVVTIIATGLGEENTKEVLSDSLVRKKVTPITEKASTHSLQEEKPGAPQEESVSNRPDIRKLRPVNDFDDDDRPIQIPVFLRRKD